MTFKDLQAMKRVSDPQISSSGKWVLFSVTEVSLEKNSKINNLWVVPIEGGKERQLTFGEVNQTSGRFSPDGKWVSLTSPGGGSSQIWTAAWDEATGTMKKPYPLTDISTEADGAVWSPDSKRLLFVSSVYPECSVKGGLDGSGVRGGVVSNPTIGSLRSPIMGHPSGVPGSLEAASWGEEAACNKAKDEAAAKSAVKAQVWDGLLYRHWNAFTGKKRSHVLVVSRANGEDIRDLTPSSVVGDAETPTFSLSGPLGYAWAPGSEEIAFVANLDKVPAASTNNDVFTLLLDDSGSGKGGAKPRKISTSLGSDDGPAYSPDGKYIAFRSQLRAGYESDRFRLMLFDRVAGTTKQLLPKFDRWVDELVWAPNAKDVYFASGNSGAENIYDYSLSNGSLSLRTNGVRAFENNQDSQVFRSENNFAEYADFHVSADGKSLVASMMTVRAPSELVTFQVDDREEYDDTNKHLVRHAFDGSTYQGKIRDVIFHAQRITQLNDSILNQLDLQRMESFTFKGALASEVQGFVVRPPNFDPAKKYPLKFLIHGGPQGAWGDAWSYRWNPELMAADGYVVVMVNPRGSTGYGQAFIDGVNGDWGGKAYIDLMKGLDAAETKFPFIDKERECALGASYGGFMANWVLTHTNRFKCIVTHDGMYNPAAAYGDTEEMWFNEWEFRRAEDFPKTSEDKKPMAGGGEVSNPTIGSLRSPIMGHPEGMPGQPWRYAALPAEQDPFRKWSPMLHVQNAKTPTLVIHSQKDYRLDVSEGFQLFTALQRLGVPSKMLYFPDEGHWILKPQNSQLWYETVGDWCDRWTKSGKYAVVGK